MLAAVLAAAALGTAAGERPEARAAREVLARLDQRLSTITSMRGRFVQTFTSAGLGVPQAESGRFHLKRPFLTRWEYADPEPKIAVSDGVHTWLHLPEENVVYRGSVASWRRGSAVALLAGGRLADAYEAEDVDAGSAARRGNVVLTLRPRDDGEGYVRVLVELEPSTLAIAAVTGVDGMGNRISAAFTDVEENPRLPDDLFSFRPPSGARIIDQDPPGR